MDIEEKYNPWNVSNLEEFLYYCCPECDCRILSRSDFINHAVINHPRSQDIIDTLEANFSNSKTSTKVKMKRAVVSLPKLSDAMIRKHTKVVKIRIKKAKLNSKAKEPEPMATIIESGALNEIKAEVEGTKPESKVPKISDVFHIPKNETEIQAKPIVEEQSQHEKVQFLNENIGQNQLHPMQEVKAVEHLLPVPDLIIYKRNGKLLCPENKTCDKKFDALTDLIKHINQRHKEPKSKEVYVPTSISKPFKQNDFLRPILKKSDVVNILSSQNSVLEEKDPLALAPARAPEVVYSLPPLDSKPGRNILNQYVKTQHYGPNSIKVFSLKKDCL